MAVTRTISGSGYGSAYIDSLVIGGRVWDTEPALDYNPWGVYSVGVSFGEAHQVDSYAEVYHYGTSGLITSENKATIESWSWIYPRNNRYDALLGILEDFKKVCNIAFVKPATPATGITFWSVDIGPVMSGASDTLNGVPGDSVWTYFNPNAMGPRNGDYYFGSEAVNVMFHEIGHALGLAHPHDSDSRFPGVVASNDLGEHGLNQGVYTVMSYNRGYSDTPATLDYGNATLGAFDIAALQAIYGANLSTRTGDNTYWLPTKNELGTGWMCIWDNGGTDTISGELSTESVIIDLQAATLQRGDLLAGGAISHQGGIAGGFTIANGVVIENATGGSGNDMLTGNDADNQLVGNAGRDILKGEAGVDTLVGGAGDDSYFVDNTGDVITELASEGEDEVYTSIDYTLLANVEILISRGGTGLRLTGNASDNTIWGDEGANRIDGGKGKDNMYGGSGSDTYFVDNAGDLILEDADEGVADLVYTSVSFKLNPAMERLYASGSSSINLTGNELANVIKGNIGNNKINGGSGNDTLYGSLGKDIFVFNTGLSSTANKDKIIDWNAAADRIFLENAVFRVFKGTGPLNKAYFKVGARAADSNDFIGYNKTTGDLWYDANGNKAGGQVVFANIGKYKAISYADFYVV